MSGSASPSVFAAYPFVKGREPHYITQLRRQGRLGPWDPEAEIADGQVIPMIRNAAGVLVFVQEPNVNVGFELGLALGFGKPVRMVSWAAPRPAWILDSVAGNLPVVEATDAQHLLALAEALRGAAGEGTPGPSHASGSPVLLCPRTAEGSVLRDEITMARPRWRYTAPESLRGLAALESLVAARFAVWAVPRPTDATRPGPPDDPAVAAGAIVAGWLLARWGGVGAWDRLRILVDDTNRRFADLPRARSFGTLSEVGGALEEWDSRPAAGVGALAAALRGQVEAEIAARVGGKYLLDVHAERPTERMIRDALAAGPEEAGMAIIRERAAAARMPAEVLELLNGSPAAAERAVEGLTSVLTPRNRKEVKAWLHQAGQLRRSVILLKDRAGSGKTTLLCNLALTNPPAERLGLFWACRFDEEPGQRLTDVLLGRIRDAVGDPELAADTLWEVLEAAGQELVVYIDGINENRDLGGLHQRLQALFHAWNHKPVRFVVSCRDIFWNFFRPDDWAPWLVHGHPIVLPPLGDDEVDPAIDRYLRHFAVSGTLGGEARERCRHPLLLRFFCETYRGRDVSGVRDFRLKDLFDGYWERKSSEIAARLGRGAAGGVDAYVLRLAGELVRRGAGSLAVRQVKGLTGEIEVDSAGSTYRRLLDEDVIVEEQPPNDRLDQSYDARRVVFVYDEFYDYMAARAIVIDEGWDDLGLGEIVERFGLFLRRRRSYEQVGGIAEYLVLIAEARGFHPPLCALLAVRGEVDVLHSVLPKLHDRRTWMEVVLEMSMGVKVPRVSELELDGEVLEWFCKQMTHS